MDDDANGNVDVVETDGVSTSKKSSSTGADALFKGSILVCLVTKVIFINSYWYDYVILCQLSGHRIPCYL